MAETQIHRRPIRAGFYGLVWGLSLFVLLVWESIILLDSLGSVLVKGILIVVGAIALSLVWAFFGPARKPKGSPPAGAFRSEEPPADAGPPPAAPAPERSPFEAATAVIEADEEDEDDDKQPGSGL